MGAKLRTGICLFLCTCALQSTLREFYFSLPTRESEGQEYETRGAPVTKIEKNVQIQATTSSSTFQPKQTASSEPTNAIRMSNSPNLDDFKLCKVEPAPKVGGLPVEVKGTVMEVEYQCDGEPYHQFADLLEDLISSEARARPEEWGRRKSIVPDHNINKQRSILILGNSHTRQLVSTLLCQYRDQIIGKPKLLYGMPKMPSYGVWEFRLQHNLTIYSATNCPFIYNEEWPQTLETLILHRSLQSLDAIVTGRFNSFSESTGTKFYQNMMEYQNAFPELKLDFEHASVPTLESISKVYSGPIVYVGMFASYGTTPYRKAQQTVEEATFRTNLAAMDGRRYIEKLKSAIQQSSDVMPPVYECSTDGRKEVSTCVMDTKSSRFKDGHRCMGSRGGHPDLIAWDVVEFLHRVFA